MKILLILLFALLLSSNAQAFNPLVAAAGSQGLGPELVLNGDFATNDTTSWEIVNTTGTASVTDYEATIIRVDASTIFSQNVGLVNGTTYRLSIKVVSESGTDIRVMDNSGHNILDIDSLGAGTHTVDFVHDEADGYIMAICVGNGDALVFDDFSVKEVL